MSVNKNPDFFEKSGFLFYEVAFGSLRNHA